MAESTEPRASTAVLTAPAFVTRNSGSAMHAANRHVERWAPEAGADRVRSLRNLGFVDRLIAPWLETAQRSSTLRMFSRMANGGSPPERETNQVSWVFPRPWYQDELDWMAAARQAPSSAQAQQIAAPTMLTTRGTYVAPQQAITHRPAMPAALYEYVAPSISIAQPNMTSAPQGVGYGGNRADVYSPLVSFASAQAAQMIGRIAPSVAATTKSPMLRDVLSTILARATTTAPTESRISQQAPELVTPPAPRRDAELSVESSGSSIPAAATQASQLATQMAEQRAQIVGLQRIAQQAAVREIAARQTASLPLPQQRSEPARTESARGEAPEQVRAEAARAEIVRGEIARSETIAKTEIARVEEARLVAARTEAGRTEAARGDQARVEAARIEERIAQRLAERQATTPRLHDQARAEAAQHARSPELPTLPTTARVEAPSAITAAIAAMPVEIASYLGARPRNAAQAITELDTAMRAIELLAQGAAGNQPFEATRGPRLVMPAGVGGLVATLDHAKAVAPQPQRPDVRSTAAVPAALQQRRELRIPTLSFATSTPAQTARAAATTIPGIAARGPADFRTAQLANQAPTSAFVAATSSAPAALSHVAWADRWLARFAGAAPRSLDAYAAATTGGMQALVDAAPGTVFVAPMFDIERPNAALAQSYSAPLAGATPATSVAAAPVSAPGRAVAPTAPTPTAPTAPTAPTTTRGPRLIPSQPQVIRYDDNAETPDDVLAAISAGAPTRRRGAAGPATAPTDKPAPALVASHADEIAHSSPVAPNAGMSAQLAASPFAPALRHLLPLTATASFDVRALFGAGLTTSYLAGLLLPSSHEVEVAAAQSTAPAWARWAQPATTDLPAMPVGERAAFDFDPTYVAPELPAAVIEHAQQQLAQEQVREDAAAQTAVIAEVAAQLVAAQVTSPTEIATIAQRVGITPSALATAVARASSPTAAAQAQAQLAQLVAAPTTTLRTALLSWDVDPAAQPSAGTPEVAASFQAPSAARPLFAAQSMIDAINLPMLGDGAAADASASWAGPGMIAERARSWSVAQERSSADLSYDFVTPELVLAARVYGLGPAEAAQAARLAVAGPGHIGAMASAVDRTFVQAMAIEVDRRQAITTAYPSSTTSEINAVISQLRPATVGAAAPVAAPQAPQAAAALPASTSSFGVERRMPRGAFLWPSASVGALGLSAAAPDGEQSMSVAALELLAAHAVAELGTYAALADRAPPTDRTAGGTITSELEVPSPIMAGQVQQAARPSAAPVSVLSPEAGAAALYQRGESSEADVLATAAALVPMARRARFDALYVALSQSPSGRTWSPAARAARAFALAGHGGDDVQGLTPQERAATAWDVLPVVYETNVDTLSGPARAVSERRGARSVADRRGTNLEQVEMRVDTRPGLANLSARAGEALGSYVSPASFTPIHASSSASSSSSSSSSTTSVGAVLRAPTAAQELVRTGRPAGRHGGGEAEIPPWFESVARKMLADRTPVSDGISLAEMTLVQAAAPQQIAAADKNPSSSASGAPAHAGSDGGSPHQMDVEKLSQDVYRHIMSMLDAARARNGEP